MEEKSANVLIIRDICLFIESLIEVTSFGVPCLFANFGTGLRLRRIFVSDNLLCESLLCFDLIRIQKATN